MAILGLAVLKSVMLGSFVKIITKISLMNKELLQ